MQSHKRRRITSRFERRPFKHGSPTSPTLRSTLISKLLSTLRASLQGVWALALLDLRLWWRTPWAIASALIPPLGMAAMLVVLSLTVTQEPIALVIQSQGAYSRQMAEMIEGDTDSYSYQVMDAQQARQALYGQEIAAIITIPPNFDQQVLDHNAHLELLLNNVDIDFADDIRRSVERTTGQFDASALDEQNVPTAGQSDSKTGNPYLISIDEHDLRQTNVDFLSYQVLPAFVLLVLHIGLMGTALLCAQDRERGTARYLALAPISDWALVGGRLLGGFCASALAVFIAGILCILTGVIAPPANHWPALILLFAATALCASGIGAILGTTLRGTRNIALAASLLATYFFFLGGGFTTIAFLPPWIQTISALNPMRYAIDGMRQAMFYPDLTGFDTDITVLLLSAIIAASIGSYTVRRSWSHL